eukprot:4145230-Prymnesium_polylepis.1
MLVGDLHPRLVGHRPTRDRRCERLSRHHTAGRADVSALGVRRKLARAPAELHELPFGEACRARALAVPAHIAWADDVRARQVAAGLTVAIGVAAACLAPSAAAERAGRKGVVAKERRARAVDPHQICGASPGQDTLSHLPFDEVVGKRVRHVRALIHHRAQTAARVDHESKEVVLQFKRRRWRHGRRGILREQGSRRWQRVHYARLCRVGARG